jgi:hypothetical protein
VRARRRLSTAATLLLLVLPLAACSGGTPAGESVSATISSRLPAGCDDVSTVVHQEDCLDSVQQRLQSGTLAYAGTGDVTHAAFQQAYTPLASAWADVTLAHSVHIDTKVSDADDAATTPISTTWNLGTTSRTMWACFHGKTVTVQTARCPS